MLDLLSQKQYGKWIRAPERKGSKCVDFGDQWIWVELWPRWEVSWIEATGELFAVEQGGEARFTVLGTFTRAEVEAFIAKDPHKPPFLVKFRGEASSAEWTDFANPY